MRRPARPAPQPTHPIARRLEDVRREQGIFSLRSFWQRVSEGWRDEAGNPAGVSYESVRKYHYDTEPPVLYLARVADVFGYSLHFLATGRGVAREHWVDEARDLLDVALASRMDRIDMDPENRMLFDKLWRLYVDRGPRDPETFNASRADIVYAGMLLHSLLTLPLNLSGFAHRYVMLPEELNNYYRAMLNALLLALAPSYPFSQERDDDRGVYWADGFALTYVADRADRLRADDDERASDEMFDTGLKDPGNTRRARRAEVIEVAAEQRLAVALRKFLRTHPAATDDELIARRDAILEKVKAELAPKENGPG